MPKVSIGLDIGTTAVRAAELKGKDPAQLTRFAQLVLPAGCMTAGEITEPDALVDALKDLWQRGSFASKRVAVSVSNQNVLARAVELPRMSEDDLRGALQFQVADYIPIPIEEALLDFVLLDEFTGEDDAPMMRVMAVAAQKDMINATVDAVSRAGLDPISIDMGPLAALRALVDPVASLIADERSNAAQAIVDIGGGVTTITVHEHGIPRFVRVLSAGGSDITAALVSELGLSIEDAEATKLSTTLEPEGSHVESGAPTIVEQRARAFIDDVRRSIEYHASQPGSSPISKVIVIGGGARLRRLAERLATAIRVPVEEGHALGRVSVGEVGLSEEQLEQVDAVGATAIGLALEPV